MIGELLHRAVTIRHWQKHHPLLRDLPDLGARDIERIQPAGHRFVGRQTFGARRGLADEFGDLLQRLTENKFIAARHDWDRLGAELPQVVDRAFVGQDVDRLERHAELGEEFLDLHATRAARLPKNPKRSCAHSWPPSCRGRIADLRRILPPDDAASLTPPGRHSQIAV
jgi:hypothetical protein